MFRSVFIASSVASGLLLLSQSAFAGSERLLSLLPAIDTLFGHLKRVFSEVGVAVEMSYSSAGVQEVSASLASCVLSFGLGCSLLLSLIMVIYGLKVSLRD